MRLVIDTALDACQALTCDGQGRLIDFERLDMARGHAEALMPLVEKLLGARRYAGIDSLAVTVGPGSFTGLRVGLAAARALALALNLPIAGVTSLAAKAAEQRGKAVTVAFDARNGLVYHQSFDTDGLALSQPAVDKLAVAASGLAVGAGLVGSGAALLQQALAALDKPAFLLDDTQQDAAHPKALALTASEVLAGLAPPAPLYLKGADAIPAAPSGLVAPSCGHVAGGAA